MPSTISPQMSLILPTIGLEPSPTWGTDLNTSLSIVDGHDHSPGNGVPINPSGLSITTDLPFLNNNATGLRSVRFTAQNSPLAGILDLGCLYVSGVDLYYNDENGNQVRITQSGGVNGSPGSIGNLTSPASATYVSATPAFVFQSDANTPANLDGGAVVVRNIAANSNGITITPPNALAANYTLTLPAGLPGQQNFLSLDSSGNVGAVWNVDNSTLQIATNVLQVKAGGIGTTQLADASVTPAKRSAANIGGPAANCGSFSSSTSAQTLITNQTVNFTSTGRPVFISMTGNTNVDCNIEWFNASTGASGTVTLYLYRDNVQITSGTVIHFDTSSSITTTIRVGIGTFSYYDYPTAGAHTYQIYISVANGTVSINDAVLNVAEL